MSGASQTPEIVRIALEQNGITAPDSLAGIKFPIKLAELAQTLASAKANLIISSDIEINILKKTASKGATSIDLTEKETDLIQFLNNSKSGASKDEILNTVWGYSAETNTRTVDTHLHRLNGKFQESFDVKLINLENSKYYLI